MTSTTRAIFQLDRAWTLVAHDMPERSHRSFAREVDVTCGKVGSSGTIETSAVTESSTSASASSFSVRKSQGACSLLESELDSTLVLIESSSNSSYVKTKGKLRVLALIGA